MAPPEGSLDEMSWIELLGVLAAQGYDRGGCYAFFGQLAAPFGEDLEVWRGDTASLPSIMDDGRHNFTPSNFWAVDRSWFVLTDNDLMATKVSGSHELIETLTRSDLECIAWPWVLLPERRRASYVQVGNSLSPSSSASMVGIEPAQGPPTR
ncbi:hypothetical protein GIS00_05800 [Nakamurella sp. YIM 132087]|uniref:Uncharacterized protein n=1 Tax=Nakamurella alba TaxID=2665158 RepID=A0A7K1FH80_9ACTN|nr:hypothetical protein [Nakamurella alba]MTD13458.1 hypothetical protein [Nakamurella alba]